MKKIGIVMGSDSDLPVVSKAVDMLKSFGVPYEIHVFSAHRTPLEAAEFSKNARENGFGAIIAAAGMAAHLAGAIAANTTLPVVGIPIVSGNLGGIDALLSTVCIEMLAIEDKELAKKLDEKRASDSAKVLEKNRAVENEYNK